MGELIFTGKILALYGQISLIDAEDISSYPQWETGEEFAVIGPKGIAVAALIDHLIEVSIFKNQKNDDDVLYFSGSFFVGNCGLLIGNEVAGFRETIPWPKGVVEVEVYANAPGGEATQMTFVLYGK